MKSEKGVTLISLLTYIAVLLTVMVVIGRITGVFGRGLDNIDSENQASSDFSKLNYCFLAESKNASEGERVTAIISDMKEKNNEYTFDSQATTPTTTDKTGTAVKFLKTKNIISYVNNNVYYNKTKICNNVQSFKVDYKENENALNLTITIDGQQFNQTYTFR